MFDAVILDPPKRLVMQKVYSKPFLDRLAQFINPGAIISCYAPDLDHSDVDSWSKEFLSTFLEGGYFRMVQAESPHVHITRFRRLWQRILKKLELYSSFQIWTDWFSHSLRVRLVDRCSCWMCVMHGVFCFDHVRSSSIRKIMFVSIHSKTDRLFLSPPASVITLSWFIFWHHFLQYHFRIRNILKT